MVLHPPVLAFMKKGRAFSTFEKKGRALCPVKTPVFSGYFLCPPIPNKDNSFKEVYSAAQHYDERFY
jgi:hypothetical protein